jgi:hypothetical protein
MFRFLAILLKFRHYFVLMFCVIVLCFWSHELVASRYHCVFRLAKHAKRQEN